jgi:hypothetical protein
VERHEWDPVCERPTGLVPARRIDPSGQWGPTRGQAQGGRWVAVGPGLYVPRERPDCVEQRILEQSARLPESGAVTGWAALRWRGATFFDGCEQGGRVTLPVPLVLGVGNLRKDPASTLSWERLAPSERVLVDGIPMATVQRAVFDEMRRTSGLLHAVTTVEMAAAAGLTCVAFMRLYIACRAAWTGVPLAREAVELASDDSRSPRETWLHWQWKSCGFSPVLRNQPVFDLDGRLLGYPDLFDPVAGLAGEYDGADHKGRERHRRDVARETCFRDHGLEHFSVVAGDTETVAWQRMTSARARSKFLPPESCAWTLTPPPWMPVPERLEDRLVRLGMLEELTHI